MKALLSLASLAVVGALIGCAAPTQQTASSGAPATKPVVVASATPAGKWSCSAQGLVSGSYSGGDWANIHIQPFSSGGSYRVQKNGNIATGVTANGTPFRCQSA
jgi:hypothetical protein